MKNKNMRDLEKHWASKKKESAKPAKGGKVTTKAASSVRTINRGGQRGS